MAVFVRGQKQTECYLLPACAILFWFASKPYVRKVRLLTGIWDVESPTPGMLRKPGELPYPSPLPKKLKRLVTRDTLPRLRPNREHSSE